MPIEENPNHNPTQIAISDDINSKEIEKPPTDVVIDHPEANKLCSMLTSLHPCNFWHKNSKPKSNNNKPITNIEPRSNDDDNNSNYRRPNKAEDLCKLIGANVNSLEKASKRMRKYEDQIKEVSEKFENLKKGGGSEDEFGELKREVMKLKQQISSKHEDEPQESESTADIDRVNADNTLKYPAFERMFDSKEFRARYDQLDSLSKNCLLCFSVFPENAEINKRVMIYWWIGEGFATTEQIANDLFINLFVERFIEPVCKMGSFAVNIWKMDPLVRSLVIEIAKTSSFFDFDDDDDDDGNVTSRACLVANGLTKIQDFEKLNTLFNFNESILEFNPEYFSKMKKLSVLYLGQWQTSVSHHIEVADTKSMKINANVLDGLENITNLRFLSLHGISRITELPESISRLTDLTILDIRACHNLEVIPNGIGLLKNLTHLDMSECYLLDQMPKGLASLYNLQVLKGFIVSESKNSCTLDDLRKFPKLRKLSIYAVCYGFPTDTDLRALNQFKALTNLTITWARGSLSDQANSDDSKKKDTLGAKQATVAAKKPGLTKALTRSVTSKPAEVSVSTLPLGLIKLDIQCFPRTITPTWLMACNLKNLKKLYIRGGKLSDLGQFQKLDGKNAEKDKWEVEILRLKYLYDLEMDWSNLQELFPKLNYLEMRLQGEREILVLDLIKIPLNWKLDDRPAENDEWEVEVFHLKYLNELEMDCSDLQKLFPKFNYLEMEMIGEKSSSVLVCASVIGASFS
ncbi:disease resistance RPP13-like protein 4 [Camellia sinensis]|uniref:disease resistance RPP13-like protein 4 n=1 Tax=Camellia sinensis TaxID=4442 RepID=UPI0010359BD0|nr:disease resistance RPP13-like protein 4 [Camellia sinensis]